MASYIGTYRNKVDRKGRVSVPARFRTAMGDQSFKGVVISPMLDLGAIEACDHARIDEVIERLDMPGAYTAEDRHMAELILARSEELPFDAEGRIMLPPALQELAEITDTAVFTGTGRTFQIWNPDRREAFERQALASAGSSLSLKDLYALGGGAGGRGER